MLLRDADQRAVASRSFFWWYLGRTGAIQINPVSSRYGQTLMDAAAVRDALEAVSGIEVSLSDASAVTELLSAVGTGQPTTLDVVLADAATLTDSLASTLTRISVDVALTDAVVLSDDLAAAFRILAGLSDAARPSESLLTSRPGEGALADAVAALASLSVTLRAIGALDDTVAVTESLLADIAASELADSVVVGVSDALLVALTIEAAAGDAATVGEALSHTHILPRTWHSAFADVLAPVESLTIGGQFTAAVTDSATPADAITSVHLRQPTGHTTSAAFATALQPAPSLSIAALPPTPSMSFVLQTDAAYVADLNPYVAYAEGNRGDVGTVIEGMNSAELNSQDVSIGWIRLYGNQVILNLAQGSGLFRLALDQTDTILLANDFGDVLYLGNDGNAPESQHLPTEAEGGGFARFRAQNDTVTAYLRRFVLRLGQSRRLMFAWYHPGPAPAELVLLPGLSSMVEVRMATQSVALAESAVVGESLVADLDDQATLSDVLAPVETLAIGGQYTAAVTDSATPADAITSVHVTRSTSHYTSTLSDVLAASESLSIGGQYSATVTDSLTSVVRDGPLVSHLRSPTRHGYGVNDILSPSERLATFEPRPLNRGVLNSGVLN